MNHKKGPLYLKVKARIREEFANLGLSDEEGAASSTRLPTLEDLQIRLEVSRPTISKALAALAAEGFLIKEAGRGTFALAPSTVALNGSRINGSAQKIGFIAPLYGAELPQRAFAGIDKVAHRRGYSVVMAGSGDSIARERIAAHEMIASGVAGLIIYPTLRQGDDADHDYLQLEANSKGKFVELPVPVVLIDTAVPAQGHHQVSFDNRRAGYQVTNWLIQQGHSKIGLVFYNETSHHPSIDARLRGYEDAVADAGYAIHPELLARIEPPGLGAQLGATLDRLLSVDSGARPTAIIATDDIMAIEIIDILTHSGVRVPEDIYVAGFDNRLEARHFQPAFTTTAPDFELMGEMAAEMLLEAIAQSSRNDPEESIAPKNYILPVPLIARTAAPVYRNLGRAGARESAPAIG